MVRRGLIALGVIAILSTTAACNTVKGLGRDIQSVGEAGEEVIT